MFWNVHTFYLIDFGVPKMGFLVFLLGVIRGGVGKRFQQNYILHESGVATNELYQTVDQPFPPNTFKGMKLGALQLALPRSFEIPTGGGCELQMNPVVGSPRHRLVSSKGQPSAAIHDVCAPVAEMRPRPRICRTRSTTYLETMFPC